MLVQGEKAHTCRHLRTQIGHIADVKEQYHAQKTGRLIKLRQETFLSRPARGSVMLLQSQDKVGISS